MSRRHFTFHCEGARCVASLDEAPGETGLFLVTGGNEVRSGAFAGQAELAARVAAEGFPVLRFDRRGIGDSEGFNFGFKSNAPDIAAARAALLEEAPQVSRVVGFGNCDAASALMLAGGAGCDALLLANPWTFEDDASDETPPAAARAHYKQRLKDPSAIKRVLKGEVSLGKLARGLLGAASPPPPPSSLAQDMAAGIAHFAGDLRYLIAERDRTGQAFLGMRESSSERVAICPGADHAFTEEAARDWLFAQVLEVLRG